MWKRGAGDRSKISLQLSLFGLHLFLGNWWNGAPFSPIGLVALTFWRAATLLCACMSFYALVKAMYFLLRGPRKPPLQVMLAQKECVLLGDKNKSRVGRSWVNICVRSGLLRQAGSQAERELDDRLLALRRGYVVWSQAPVYVHICLRC